MHRAYRPVKPAQSRLLQRRWEDRYYEDHRRKVIEARPTVDTRPPQTYMHLHLKLKKLQMEEERLYTIERDNRILLGKMSNIMKAKASVDNRNSYESKSLNRDQRVRDLLRVGNENQQILRRITTKKPQYDHAEWQKDWETNQQYMDRISSYPKDWWKKSDEYSDGTPRSSRGGGGTTRRSSRTNDDDDSRDSSPRQDKKKTQRKKKEGESEEEDGDRSYSEDEEDEEEAEERRRARRRDAEKKGKRQEEDEERDRRKDEKIPWKDRYVDTGKQESKRKGK